MPTTPTYNYYIKKSTEGNYQETTNYTGTNTSYTFTGLTQGTKYDVKSNNTRQSRKYRNRNINK